VIERSGVYTQQALSNRRKVYLCKQDCRDGSGADAEVA
jgi:hypothetical protein